MIEKKHLIFREKTLLEALIQINSVCGYAPLVLFVLDENERMIGTLTDGDSRRALISGFSVQDKVYKVMQKNFNYIMVEDLDDVKEIKRQKDMKMKLVPVLDNDNHIVEIIDLEKYKPRLPIDAVLMAGGKGERLIPLTEKTPKPLLTVGNKAIIDHNVDRLVSYGIKDIAVTVNYLGEQLEKHYALPRKGVQVKTIREPKFLGTIGGVQYIKDLSHDTVLIMNADLFTNIDIEAFYLHFVEHHADISAATVPYSVSLPYGIFDLEGQAIKGIKEKPTYNYFVNAGIYLVKKEVLRIVPKNQMYNATDLITDCVNAGKKVITFPLIGYWYDMGTKEDFQRVSNLIIT